MGLLWHLHRSDFAADIEAGRHLFERANFITSNSEAFSDRPEADLCLANDIQAIDLRVGLASYLQLPVATYLERRDDLLCHQTQALKSRSTGR